MKKFYSFLVAMLLSVVAFAYDVEIDGIYYNLDRENKTATITRKDFRKEYDEDSDDYVYSWEWGFTYTQEEIIIPSFVISNGESYSVSSIGAFTFYECSSLKTIEIPNSVVEIGPRAFEGTAWLENQSDGLVYINDILYCCKGEFSENAHVKIKSGTKSIAGYAFGGCSSLASIEIPNSVIVIGEGAFYDCTSLTSIEIPKNVTKIGYKAFYNCSSLTSISIPNSITLISNLAFRGCSSLISITWDAKKCDIFLENFDRQPLFYDIREQIISFTFGDKVEDIPEDLCSGMNKLVSINIPSSVTEIGYGAFEDCSSLTSIEIPNSVTKIGGSAFRGCSSLKSVDLGNSVTKIGSSAFSRCSSLISIDIPNSVTSIGDYAFSDCSSLESIEVDKNNQNDQINQFNHRL